MWLKSLTDALYGNENEKGMGNMRNSEHGHIPHPGPAKHLHLMPNHKETTLNANDYRGKKNKDKNEQ